MWILLTTGTKHGSDLSFLQFLPSHPFQFGKIARTYPGVACCEAVHGDEGAVELAELVRRILAEEGNPHD
jgi:hypothetical protein